MTALIVSMLSGLTAALFSLGYKLRGRRTLPYDALMLAMSIAYALFAAVAVAAFREPLWDPAAAWLGALLAVSTLVAIRLYFEVTATARLNVTWLVIQSSILIPFAVSVVGYRESLSTGSIAGVSLMFASILLFGGRGPTPAPGAGIGGRLAVSAALSGVASAVPRVYASAAAGGGVFTLLLWQGITSTIAAALMCARSGERLSTGSAPLAGLAAYMSFFNVVSTALLLVALRQLDGAVVFPVRAVGNVAAVFALSFLLFRERVRPLEAVGAAAAAAGIALVSASLARQG